MCMYIHVHKNSHIYTSSAVHALWQLCQMIFPGKIWGQTSQQVQGIILYMYIQHWFQHVRSHQYGQERMIKQGRRKSVWLPPILYRAEQPVSRMLASTKNVASWPETAKCSICNVVQLTMRHWCPQDYKDAPFLLRESVLHTCKPEAC